jgi:hypothetical protein
MSAQFDHILTALVQGEIRFVLIGGVAGIIHGAARLTYDVDIVYERSAANIKRLAQTLKPLSPYLRGAAAGLPFVLDEKTIRNGLNFTLTTALGDLDLLGEVVGGGGYGQLLSHSSEIEAFGVTFRCVNLRTLIQLKRAAGRPKDLESLAELETLLEEEQK